MVGPYIIYYIFYGTGKIAPAPAAAGCAGPGSGGGYISGYAEHLEWLEKNYLEEAKKLAELKEKKPDLYMRQTALSLRKYRRIAEASKDNPELEEVLNKKFDLIVRRK